MRKFLIAFWTAVFLSVLSVSCFASGDTLHVGVAIDAKNLDPQNSVDTYSFSMIKQIYEPLVTVDGKTRKLVPVLAESWEIVDPQTYRFHLKHGVKFHNGEELTADDVVFSLKRATSKDSVFAGSKGKFIDPNGFKVEDKYTVIVKTRGPFGGFLQSMKHPYAMILSRKAVESAGKEYFRQPVGTGPYKFVKWIKGESLALEAFKDYHGNKPKFAKMVFDVLPDDSSRVIALETGREDIIYAVPYSEYDRLNKSDKVKVARQPGLVLIYMGMNVKSPKLSDPRVRLAIEYAVDKEALNKVIYQGNSIPAVGPLLPACSFYPEKAKAYGCDVEKSKALLKEAGVKDLKLSLWVINSQDLIDAATVIQSMLARVGISLSVQVLENGVFNDRTKGGTQEMFLYMWGMQTNRDAGVYWQALFAKSAIGSTNLVMLDDKEVDDGIQRANSEVDEAKRNAIFASLWDRLNAIHPWVYLSIPSELYGAQKGLKGVEDLFDGKINYLGDLHY